MSTRAVIARVGEAEGTFRGVYSHSDGYPTWMGPHLWNLLFVTFSGDLKKMLAELIDGHPAGWSVFGERCYCHPRRSQDPEWRKRPAEKHEDWRTEKNTLVHDTDIEWIWAFDEQNNKLFVRDMRSNEDAGIVDLSQRKPLTKKDWYRIECGENLERCKHYAWVHGLAPETSRLSTQTYLGRHPFEFHDAVAFIVNGRRLMTTGSGGNSDFLNEMRGTQFPPETWVSSVRARNGRRVEVVTAKITKDGYAPYDGVQWVMPRTKDNEAETIIGGGACAE